MRTRHHADGADDAASADPAACRRRGRRRALPARRLAHRLLRPVPDRRLSRPTSAPIDDRGCADVIRSRPGTERDQDLQAAVVPQGPGGRTDPDHAARTPGDGVCGARRPAADHRSVHVDPLPGVVRGVRALQDPRPRSRLLARTHDRRNDPAAGGRERGSGPRGRPRLGPRAPDGRDHRPRGRRRARLRGGPGLQAHDDRLPERAGLDDHGRPAPQALRLLRGGRRLHR